MTRSTIEEKNKYSKRIDEIIEDAEIEAELEAEKKTRSKRAKLASVSLVGAALLVALYFGMHKKSETPSAPEAKQPQVAELPQMPEPKPIPFPTENKNSPLPPIQDKLSEPAPVAKPVPQAKQETPPQPAKPSAKIKDELEKLEKLSATSKVEESAKTPEASDSKSPIQDNKPLLKNKPKTTDKTAIPSSKAEHKISKAQSKRTPVIKEDKVDRMAYAPTLANERNRAASKPGEDKQNPNKTGAAPVADSESPINLNRQAASKAATAKEQGYFVQMGVFAIKSNADKLSGKLKSKGFQPNVHVQSSYDLYHAVYVGGFPDGKSSEPTLKDLTQAGYHPFLEKNPDNTLSFLLGKFRTKNEADDLKNKLSLMGFPTSIKNSSAETTKYIVRIGGFNSSEDARSAQQKLTEAGFAKTLIRSNG